MTDHRTSTSLRRALDTRRASEGVTSVARAWYDPESEASPRTRPTCPRPSPLALMRQQGRPSRCVSTGVRTCSAAQGTGALSGCPWRLRSRSTIVIRAQRFGHKGSPDAGASTRSGISSGLLHTRPTHWRRRPELERIATARRTRPGPTVTATELQCARNPNASGCDRGFPPGTPPPAPLKATGRAPSSRAGLLGPYGITPRARRPGAPRSRAWAEPAQPRPPPATSRTASGADGSSRRDPRASPQARSRAPPQRSSCSRPRQ